tara:strand:+ start:361 stop:558 length:198 start_codon:yes stop_codon:yes gene_type:complete
MARINDTQDKISFHKSKVMKTAQDRYFVCLENCHYHEQIETPKRICLAALTDDPFDNPKVSIDQS